VRNLPDGRVEAIFQGEAAEVNAMIQWCRQGPSLAQVTELEVLEEAMDDESIDPSLPIFEIRRD
jgi:acylphosphatase